MDQVLNFANICNCDGDEIHRMALATARAAMGVINSGQFEGMCPTAVCQAVYAAAAMIIQQNLPVVETAPFERPDLYIAATISVETVDDDTENLIEPTTGQVGHG